MNEQVKLSDGEIEEAFFRGALYTICKCGHCRVDHDDGKNECTKLFCICVKFEKEEK